MINLGVFERVFRIATATDFGTCFAIEFQDRQYLVTVAHLVARLSDPGELQIWRAGGWEPLVVRTVGVDESRDIAVLAADKQLCPAFGLLVGPKHISVGQDVFFLGFPYGLTFDNGPFPSGYPSLGFPIPVVKRATVSALCLGRPSADILLDGHNNPGFSGGPVVFERLGAIRPSVPGAIVKTQWRVAGIIRSYSTEEVPVSINGKATRANVPINTGIIQCVSIYHAVKLILDQPVGPLIAQTGSIFTESDNFRRKTFEEAGPDEWK